MSNIRRGLMDLPDPSVVTPGLKGRIVRPMDEPRKPKGVDMPQGNNNGGAMSVRSLNELLGKAIQETASGKCSVESAKAIASLAAQMNNLLRTGLDAMRLQHEIGEHTTDGPVALVLGVKTIEADDA